MKNRKGKLHDRHASTWRKAMAAMRVDPNLQYEYHRACCVRELEEVMDGRKNIKYLGQHGAIPAPAPTAKLPPEISYSRVSMLMSHNAVIEHDVKNQIRILYFRGKPMGKVHHRDMMKLEKEFRMAEARKPGTNIVVYRVV